MIIDPYKIVPSGPTDPQFSSVIGLYHLDNSGANVVTGIPDIELSGTAAYSAGSPKWGSHGLDFDGSANCFALNASPRPTTAISFGSGEYAVETYFRAPASQPGAFSGLVVVLDCRPSTASSWWQPTISFDNTTRALSLTLNGSVRITSSNSAVIADTWHYVAIARVSGVTRMYIDGTKVGSDFTDANTYYLEGTLLLGAAPNGAARLNGDIDEVRVTKGSGRGYSGATIPVPTEAFPNS